jgi:hypothetical protein
VKHIFFDDHHWDRFVEKHGNRVRPNPSANVFMNINEKYDYTMVN